MTHPVTKAIDLDTYQTPATHARQALDLLEESRQVVSSSRMLTLGLPPFWSIWSHSPKVSLLFVAP